MRKIKEYFKRIIELLEEISAKLDSSNGDKDKSPKASQPGGGGQKPPGGP